MSTFILERWKQRLDPCCLMITSTRFRVPPMLVRRYVEEIGSAAMLAAKRSTDITPEVNLREHIRHMPLPSMNKAAHSGFETQRRHHQKSKMGAMVAPQKGLMSSDNLKKTKKQQNNNKNFNIGPMWNCLHIFYGQCKRSIVPHNVTFYSAESRV